jgi:hypothetical protein
MIIKKWLFVPLVLATVLLGGCASVPKINPKDETVSLVFGYIDMKDAPSGLGWVSIKQYSSDPQYYTVGVKDGLFYHIGVVPGSYQVETFGGSGGIPILAPKQYQYNFGTRGRNDTAIRIDRPGVYFMGAYKYIEHPGGLFKADKFEMQPIKSPSEKELLQKLINFLESDSEMSAYTRQIAIAKKRLAALH